jgi:hypothetical protein
MKKVLVLTALVAMVLVAGCKCNTAADAAAVTGNVEVTANAK